MNIVSMKMKCCRSWRTVLIFGLLAAQCAAAQENRLVYNHHRLFLSGANLAWVNFASDIGPGTTDVARFADILQQMHDHGGNAVRWWLHTTGSVTPQFNDTGAVSGPGLGTIEDMKAVLDLAWERKIGVTLCLWSFDMLRTSNGSVVLERNRRLLTDTACTRAYINNSLIPMVEALRGHPAIIAWEIFNEPEGMSSEFGWSSTEHVPMSAIERFINLCAGAIHRHDPAALVTNGSWSFYASTDVANLARTGGAPQKLSAQEQADLEQRFAQRYGFSLSADEITSHLDRGAASVPRNYYRDDRLIASGGDSAGTLDFYSVHFYVGISGRSDISPFHHPVGYWALTKPVLVAEFALQPTFGIAKDDLTETLYQLGYAGALAWSWTDPSFSTAADMLSSMQGMWDNHRADVDVMGSGSDEPPSAPSAFALDQNFPNPFNPGTTIRFALAEPGHVTITVCDMLGRAVMTVLDGEFVAGRYAAFLDATSLASGVYVYTMRAAHGGDVYTVSKRMVLMK